MQKGEEQLLRDNFSTFPSIFSMKERGNNNKKERKSHRFRVPDSAQ